MFSEFLRRFVSSWPGKGLKYVCLFRVSPQATCVSGDMLLASYELGGPGPHSVFVHSQIPLFC